MENLDRLHRKITEHIKWNEDKLKDIENHLKGEFSHMIWLDTRIRLHQDLEKYKGIITFAKNIKCDIEIEMNELKIN